jgi:hypothetical protein
MRWDYYSSMWNTVKIMRNMWPKFMSCKITINRMLSQCCYSNKYYYSLARQYLRYKRGKVYTIIVVLWLMCDICLNIFFFVLWNVNVGIIFDEDGIVHSIQLRIQSKEKYDRDSACFVRQFNSLVDKKTGAKVSWRFSFQIYILEFSSVCLFTLNFLLKTVTKL